MRKRNYKVKRRFYVIVIMAAAILSMLFCTVEIANAGTTDSVRYKYYTSIQIEEGSSLWDIAQIYMTEEYASTKEYIEEVKEINHMSSDLLYGGAYLCVPYYSSEYK